MYGLSVRKLDLLHNDHTPKADWIIVRSPSTKRLSRNLERAADVPGPLGCRCK